MKTMQFEVRQTVTVSLDETKFTPEFMEEFNSMIFDAGTVEDGALVEHGQHLAQLAARGVIPDFITTKHGEFIEGYGPSAAMGIAVRVLQDKTEVLDAND